jgi:hypothetical protein
MTACLLAGALSALLQPRIEAFTQPPVSAGRRGELVWMGTEGVAAYAYVDKRGPGEMAPSALSRPSLRNSTSVIPR